MKPILRWPGGKTQLLTEIKKYINLDTLQGHTFYEPFIGGGALAFDLGYRYTIINDINPELANLYRVIKSDPEGLIKELKKHQEIHSQVDKAKNWYYEVRAWDREPGFWDRPAVEIAARTVYLNKTCFNGLFRVNSKGYFNAPLGRTSSGKVPDIIQEDIIRELSEFLKTVEIRSGDFVQVTRDAQPGSIIFMDPPYEPDENIKTAGFVGYQKEGWSYQDLCRLKEECDRLVQLGCKVVITNNDTTSVRELFSNYNIQSVNVKRSINRDGQQRKGCELIIRSKNF